MQRWSVSDSVGAESDVEAFAHGYVALQLFNTDCKCVLKVNWRASYE